MSPAVSRILLTTLAIILAGGAYWSLHYFGQYRPFADLMDTNQGSLAQIGLEVNDAVLIGRAQGRMLWRISAQKVDLSKDQRSVTADGLHDGLLYDQKGHPAISVSAAHATYSSLTAALTSNVSGVMDVSGGLQAKLLGKNGMIIQTDHLIWNSVLNSASCPGGIKAHLPNGAVTADAATLTVDTATKEITMTQVSGTFRLPSSVE